METDISEGHMNLARVWLVSLAVVVFLPLTACEGGKDTVIPIDKLSASDEATSDRREASGDKIAEDLGVQHVETVPVDELFTRFCANGVESCLFPPWIVLKGVFYAVPDKCTQAYCPGKCCNSCTGSPVLWGQSVTVALNMPGLICGGSDCKVDCPGLRWGDTYTMIGMLRMTDGHLMLDVEGYEPTNPPGIHPPPVPSD